MKHRIAVAGCGRMATTWVEYALAQQNAEIVALVDLSDTAAKNMAAAFGLSCPHFTDIREAIEKTGPTVVFDLTVPDSHIKVTPAALQMGVNVIGEKPMATNFEDCKAMVRVAANSGKSYALMQNRRYLRRQRNIRSFLDTGALGKVVFLNADFFIGTHFVGFRQMMDHPLLLDMAVHTFDQARAIGGANPVSVYCHEFSTEGSTYRGNASAVCVYEMDDGSVFCYRGSWSCEGASTEWESDWRISCVKGTVVWRGDSEPTADRICSEPQERMTLEPVTIPDLYKGREQHLGCLDELFLALEEKRPAETDCRDNLETMKMVFGAIKSAEEKRKFMMAELG